MHLRLETALLASAPRDRVVFVSIQSIRGVFNSRPCVFVGEQSPTRDLASRLEIALSVDDQDDVAPVAEDGVEEVARRTIWLQMIDTILVRHN